MGILTTYAIYKYGKSRAEKRAAEELEMQLDICDSCGYPRYLHSQDEQELCPENS